MGRRRVDRDSSDVIESLRRLTRCSNGRSAVIDALLERAARGESGSLVVRGEAGMGKTALLRRASAKRVLRVTGVEPSPSWPLPACTTCFGPLVDRLPRLPAPQRAALAAALGLASGEGRERFLGFRGRAFAPGVRGRDRPSAVRGRRAQWLDEPSADSLKFTARRRSPKGS